MARLAGITLWEVALPLTAPVSWTVGGTAADVPYLVAVFEDDAGRQGVAEILCRPEWNGVTPGLLAHALEDMAWPRLQGCDTDLPVAAAAALSGLRGATALVALCDNAWRDLVAPATAPCGPVPVAALLTRAAPAAMAEAAQAARATQGITAFKVKLGQGLATDAAVLHGLRGALGDAAHLSGDANGSYGPDDMPALLSLARDVGLAFLEDPVPMAPDASLGRLCAQAQAAGVALLADKSVTGTDLLAALADRGVHQVSAKPGRLGRTLAERIAAHVGAGFGAGGGATVGAHVSSGGAADIGPGGAVRRGRLCNGTYSESALGAAAQIAFAQALPPGLAHPHEVTFHHDLAAQIAPHPVIADGLAQPVTGRLADRLDHDALARWATARHGLGRALRATPRALHI